MKLKKRVEHKEVIENHVNEKNFNQFFDDIKDIFVSIFGS